MAISTNHDQEDLLDGIQAVEGNVESQITALKGTLQTLSNRRKAIVDALALLPNEAEASEQVIADVAQLQADMTDFDTLVPTLPE